MADHDKQRKQKTVINFSPPRISFYKPPPSVRDALRSDWVKVGRDLNRALAQLQLEEPRLRDPESALGAIPEIDKA